MTVTAQSRQREREEKRKQKLKRSQERQKKKSKNKPENSASLLTEADKNLLEKWSKMQAKVPSNPNPNSQNRQRLKSDSSTGGAEKDSIAKQMQPAQSVSSQNHADIVLITDTNPSKTNNAPLHRVEVAPSRNPVDAVKTIPQINMSAAMANDTRTMPNQRRIMPKGSNTFTGATIVSTGTTLPSTFTYQLAVGQNVVNQATSQGTAIYAGNVATVSGVPLNTTSVSDQSQIFKFALPQNSVAGISVLNNFQQGNNTSGFQPINSVPNKASSVQPKILPKMENSPVSDEKSYRSRIYSDRETPSPPLAISPPTYEEALKAKQETNSKNDAEGQDFLTSLDDISPFKPSPTTKLDQAASLPFSNEASNADLASMIQNLDILPPTLALTPKGDGAGYGLDLDFEDLLSRTLDFPSGVRPPSR